MRNVWSVPIPILIPSGGEHGGTLELSFLLPRNSQFVHCLFAFGKALNLLLTETCPFVSFVCYLLFFFFCLFAFLGIFHWR